MRENVEFAEFTPMQLEKCFYSYFIFFLFFCENGDTFETATNFDLLKKKIPFILRKKRLCFTFKARFNLVKMEYIRIAYATCFYFLLKLGLTYQMLVLAEKN